MFRRRDLGEVVVPKSITMREFKKEIFSKLVKNANLPERFKFNNVDEMKLRHGNSNDDLGDIVNDMERDLDSFYVFDGSEFYI